MSEKTWGGRREGAGRPKSDAKRKRHALCFLENEWELIQLQAMRKNLSPRAYIFSLVEADAKVSQ